MPKRGLQEKLVDVTREWLFGRVMPKAFLKHLQKHLKDTFPDRATALMAEIRAQIPPILAASDDVFPDEAGRDMLEISATALAAFRVLSPVIGDEEKTIELFRHIASQFGLRSTRLGTRLLMAKPGSKIATIDSTFKGSAPILGKAWEVTFTRDGDQFFEMRFTRCGFHDFFARNGVEQLTTLFCAWDRTWLDEITPERNGIEATRPTTLGYGGGACPFQFRATTG
ncbi:MAG: L-2-amino-thiazoline-4-carboxylic acid hydrolase [Dehalococcoidia bacterium]